MQNSLSGLLAPLVLVLPLAFPESAGAHPAGFEYTSGLEQDGIEARIMALEEMANGSSKSSLQAFLDDHLAPGYVEREGEAALLTVLTSVREKCGNAGAIEITQPGPEHIQVEFETRSGLWAVQVLFLPESDSLIAGLELTQGEERARLEPMTWENFEARLLAYEREGFCGSILLAKDGHVLHQRGYGMANASLGAPNKADTIFAIGSTPIDFTRAAILMLEDRGKLTTSDLMSKHLGGVPADKAAITLSHLMRGGSGLRNFHGIRGVDTDIDLTYIDRKEALHRIFSSALLFEPGTQNAHSHSAWGVLAAIVEQASGQKYGDFLEEHIFEKVGMSRTGMYPDSLQFEDADVAMGEVRQPFGKSSTPKNWGETSWLVMGSGGMVSTVGDLYALMEAVRAGELLSEAAQQKYWMGGVLAGGNDRGFLTLYTEGPGLQLVLCSNSHEGGGDQASQIAEALAEFVLSANSLPFAIGIAVQITSSQVLIVDVVVGSAAEKAGLKKGDVVMQVNGKKALECFNTQLKHCAATGSRLSIEIIRQGKTQSLSITPRRR